jgi:hypothetical protein
MSLLSFLSKKLGKMSQVFFANLLHNLNNIIQIERFQSTLCSIGYFSQQHFCTLKITDHYLSSKKELTFIHFESRPMCDRPIESVPLQQRSILYQKVNRILDILNTQIAEFRP